MFKNLNPEALGISSRDSEIIELVLSNGFKGLDLNLAEFAEQVQSQGFAKAARLITSARLKIGSFALPVALEDDAAQHQKNLERLGALAEIAAQIGCSRATTMIEPGSDARPYHENFQFYQRRLAEAGEVLSKHKIRLGVGFLAPLACRRDKAFTFMQTADEMVLLLRSVGHDNVGLALDSWHWHLGGGKVDTLRALPAGSVVTVALSDAQADETSQSVEPAARRLPGEGGAIDNASLLTALAELGYDGPVTPLVGESHLASASRAQVVKQAAAALDAVWKAAGLNAAGKLATVQPGR